MAATLGAVFLAGGAPLRVPEPVTESRVRFEVEAGGATRLSTGVVEGRLDSRGLTLWHAEPALDER